jgi:hypothetical protein
MSTKKRLHEKAKESQRKLKELEGRTTGAATNWESIVTEYCETIEEHAAVGEEKHFFDMRDFNQATITKVSMALKERLGDVLVIVSPRGIEADWEVQD